jgi:hypothetical protein
MRVPLQGCPKSECRLTCVGMQWVHWTNCALCPLLAVSCGDAGIALFTLTVSSPRMDCSELHSYFASFLLSATSILVFIKSLFSHSYSSDGTGTTSYHIRSVSLYKFNTSTIRIKSHKMTQNYWFWLLNLFFYRGYHNKKLSKELMYFLRFCWSILQKRRQVRDMFVSWYYFHTARFEPIFRF